MIVGIEGTIEHKEPTLVHVNTNGLVYEVFISLQSYGAITGERVKLHTSHIIREDAQLLYGFIEKSEKVLFERLVKISGVGPKVGMAICSTFTASQFGEVIATGDITRLKRVPGIGPKSAGRILVELNGFDAVLSEEGSMANPAASEASMALESLGFKKEQIAKVLSICSATDTPGLVKEALKKLQTL
ncbi:MAG: Holliday junction branch migration protein RuvA [Helicobacteraceae bacterium]|jgi:Holliday junction DNA helicase RuvA|nr:Holliday junction branch migration protein RuvA [Helicobacteraceae bacterium]